MNRIERKTIAQLIAEQNKQEELNTVDIEAATDKIHGDGSKVQRSTQLEETKNTRMDEGKPRPVLRTVRTSVDIPAKIHPTLKKIVIDLNTDLKSFFLEAGLEKLERLGYKIEQE